MKNIRNLIVFIFVFMVAIGNVAADNIQDSGTTGTGGSGGSTSGEGCGRHTTEAKGCVLQHTAGMRVSIMQKQDDGTYTVYKSKSYLQPGFDRSQGRVGMDGGDGHARFYMYVDYTNPGGYWGSRYEYLTGTKPVKVLYNYSRRTSDSTRGTPSKVTKGDVVITELDASTWTQLDYAPSGYRIGTRGYTYTEHVTFKDIEIFKEILGEKPANADFKVEESNFYKYVTSNRQITLCKNDGRTCKKIQGMGMDWNDLKEKLCSNTDVFILLEPMIGENDAFEEDGKHVEAFWLGTATEIAKHALKRHGKTTGENNINLWWHYTYGAYITSSNGDEHGIPYEFPFIPVTRDKLTKTLDGQRYSFGPGVGRTDICANYVCIGAMNAKDAYFGADYKRLYSTVKQFFNNEIGKNKKYVGVGVGMNYVWVGWTSELCNRCYRTDKIQTKNNPKCDTNNDRTVTVTQKMTTDSNACKDKNQTEVKKIVKKANKYGNLAYDPTPNKYENYCAIYCTDSATITYPSKLDGPVYLDPNRGKNGKMIWPDPNKYELVTTIKKTCRTVVNGTITEAQRNQCYIKAQDYFTANYANSNVTADFAVTYTDETYGKSGNNLIKFDLDMKNVGSYTCTGDCNKKNNPSQADLEKRVFTMIITKTGSLKAGNSYSVYDRNTNTYVKRDRVSNISNARYENFNVGQLAVGASAVRKDGDNKVYQTNVITNKVGYKDNLLVENASKISYACKYTVEVGSCVSCKSRTTNESIDVCCLAPTSGEAYEKYCENGYLKNEYDTAAQRKKLTKACSCTDKEGQVHNMYDDKTSPNSDEQACMQVQYKSGKTYEQAYEYCLKKFVNNKTCSTGGEDKCPDGSTPREYLTCLDTAGKTISECRQAYCGRTYRCEDNSHEDEVTVCVNSGKTLNTCRQTYCNGGSNVLDGPSRPTPTPTPSTPTPSTPTPSTPTPTPPASYTCPEGKVPTNKTQYKNCIEQGNGYEVCSNKYCVVKECPKGSTPNEFKTCLNAGTDYDDCVKNYCDDTKNEPTCPDGSTPSSFTACWQGGESLDVCRGKYCPSTNNKCPNGDMPEKFTSCLNSGKSYEVCSDYCVDDACPGGTCPDKTCPTNSKYHAGEVIPDDVIQKYGSYDNAKAKYCNCTNSICITSCICPRGTDKQYTYITNIARQILSSGQAANDTEACNLAKKTSCSNASEIYLYHEIDLKNPFVDSTLNANSSIDSRTPGTNWNAKNNALTNKYITSTATSTYDQNATPLYTIELDPGTISAVRSYNGSHDYSDFTLKCDTQSGTKSGMCMSTFLRDNESMKRATSGSCYNQNSNMNVTNINKLDHCTD